MRVTLLLAHSRPAPSMKRVAEAIRRYLPAPTDLQYVSQTCPTILRWKLPAAVVHALYVLHTQRCLQRQVARFPRFDVLHLVDHSDAFLLPATSAALKVVACHDLIPLVEARMYRHRLSRRWGQWLYRLAVHHISSADGVIACSRATASDLTRLFHIPPERLRVVSHGVDADFFAPLPDDLRAQKRAELGFPPQEKVLLHVGSNAPYKNIPTVLRTVAHLRGEGHPCRLVKAGEPLSARMQRLVNELGLTGQILVLPQVDDSRLRDLYQAADAVLFPSFREGFGLPVLESLACGTPAVIADTPALNEWAAEVCLHAPPDDVKQLAAKVLESIEMSRYACVRARLREFAEQYHWQSIAQQIMAAYQQWREA